MNDDIPTRGGDIIRFTPPQYDQVDPTRPIYHLRVPRLYERAKFWRAVNTHGVTYPSDSKLDAALLAAIERSGLDADTLAAFRTLVEANRAAAEAGGDEAKEFAESDEAQRLAAIERDVMAADPAYAGLAAARVEYVSVMNLVAFQMFVAGWINAKDSGGTPVGYKRAFDLVDEEAMGYLPDADIAAVGTRIIGLLRPSKAQEKNSASPRPSQDSPAPSPSTTTT